jgi:SnoaL-like domain
MLTKQGIVVTWKSMATGLVCVLACYGAFSMVQAQQKSVTLTAADRLEIQELMNRYMFILDSCPDHNNGYDYADLYTEDGTFGNGKGREMLAAAAGRTPDGGCKAIRRRGTMNQIHMNISPIIEAAPGGARGISYLMMIDGPTNEIYWNGWYQDVYAKTAKGWRFKSRLHVGGDRAGMPTDLFAARMLWEDEPTPAGSRTLLGKAKAREKGSISVDPLKWLASGKPSVWTGN